MCGKPKANCFPIKNNEGVIGEQHPPPPPQSTAMLQRLQNEDSIAQAFINKLDSEGKKGDTTTKCGFFISKTHYFLSASPDAILLIKRKAPLGS